MEYNIGDSITVKPEVCKRYSHHWKPGKQYQIISFEAGVTFDLRVNAEDTEEAWLMFDEIETVEPASRLPDWF